MEEAPSMVSHVPGHPRHAQVVPAFVALSVRGVLDSWVGDVRPAELLSWEQKADLPDLVRRDLRQTIIKRTRVRADRLWCQPTGVRFADGWRGRLPGPDQRQLDALDFSAKPLETWTLRQFKQALRAPLERALDLLARLEAVYWEPPSPASRPPPSPSQIHQNSAPPVQNSAELRELAAAVLRLPWATAITRDDLRFGYGADEPFLDWLRARTSGDLVPAFIPGLLERLVQADKLKADEEARDLARHAAAHCAPRLGSAEIIQRWISMLMRRHISRCGAGRVLSEVGAEFGVTRERVRQVCDAFEEVLAGAEVVTPALDRVLKAAARVAPTEVDDLDEQLRRFIGEEAGLESLVSWAQVLGRSSIPVTCQRARVKVRGERIDVTVVQAANSPSWLEPMLRHVNRDSSMFGCTNVLRIAGRLALKEEVAPGQEAIEAALEAAEGFRWLDRETGWFTLGDGSTSSAASRVRKIMAVAHDSVGTDEIAAALASDDMMMYRETSSLGLATPPVHVLRELFRAWAWLKLVQKGRFTAAQGFDSTGVLSEVERGLVAIISEHEGVACRFELKELVEGRLGMTEVLLAATLGSSPIIERIEHGLYRVRGRRISDQALAQARRRLREKVGLASFEVTATGFSCKVTDASLRNEQYHVPTRLQPPLIGKQHHVVSEQGQVLGMAKVRLAGVLVGLNRLFPDLRPGDSMWVEIVPDGLQVRRVHAPDLLAVSSDIGIAAGPQRLQA